MDSSTIASIVIAIVAALTSTVSLYFTYYTTRRSEERATQAELNKQLKKYSQPLLIAAFDLQARLFELVDLPISNQALECEEGREDLFVFTCYRLARFLAASYILRESTHFLSMRSDSKPKTPKALWHQKKPQQRRATDEEKPHDTSASASPDASNDLALDDSTSRLRDLLYKIDDELDRRRDARGQNYAVLPAARLLISERMLLRPSDTSTHQDILVKDWNTFRAQWDAEFRDPCAWFVGWLTTFIDQRKDGTLENPKWRCVTGLTSREDDHLRCLQHLLCDLVRYCDLRGLYNDEGAGAYPKCRRSYDCDCVGPHCAGSGVGARHKTRMQDADLADGRSKEE